MRKIMVFGVFDGLHEGHRSFLKEARSHGDYLIAVVTQDRIVEQLKGKLPAANLAERFEHLKKEDSVDEVAIGDDELGQWSVVEKHQPEVLALGYDQTALKEDLENYLKKSKFKNLKIKIMSAYEPNKYHSSLLNE